MTEPYKAYRPIACAAYDQLEVAILHGRHLRVQWCELGGEVQTDTLLPLDLETRGGEEFLIARTQAGEILRLRLDGIISADAAA